MKHRTTLLYTVIALLVAGFFHENAYFIYWMVGIPIAYLIVLACGAGLIQFNYFVNSINKGVGNGVALTFDDGPDPKITSKILDILAQEKVTATFFVIGHQVAAHPQLLKRMYDEGHTIGNHSYSHTKKLTTASTLKLKEDMEKCSGAIQAVIMQRPRFFRPPFGVTNPRYKKALLALRLISIGWSLRSLDTKTTDAKGLLAKVIQELKNGSIVLFHDTQAVTLEVLPLLIGHCKKNGTTIVSLPEFINEQAYE